MTSEQLILSYGFYASGNCDCGGVRNDKYRKGPFIIYIRKTKDQFKIKRNNEVLVPLKKLNEFASDEKDKTKMPIAQLIGKMKKTLLTEIKFKEKDDPLNIHRPYTETVLEVALKFKDYNQFKHFLNN